MEDLNQLKNLIKNLKKAKKGLVQIYHNLNIKLPLQIYLKKMRKNNIIKKGFLNNQKNVINLGKE